VATKQAAWRRRHRQKKTPANVCGDAAAQLSGLAFSKTVVRHFFFFFVCVCVCVWPRAKADKPETNKAGVTRSTQAATPRADRFERWDGRADTHLQSMNATLAMPTMSAATSPSSALTSCPTCRRK